MLVKLVNVRRCGARMSPVAVYRDSLLSMRRVELGVGVGRVSVPAPAAAEHHVAAMHRALVHLSQVHCAEVDLEEALVAEGFHTDIALDLLLAGGWADKGNANIIFL